MLPPPSQPVITLLFNFFGTLRQPKTFRRNIGPRLGVRGGAAGTPEHHEAANGRAHGPAAEQSRHHGGDILHQAPQIGGHHRWQLPEHCLWGSPAGDHHGFSVRLLQPLPCHPQEVPLAARGAVRAVRCQMCVPLELFELLCI